MAAAHAPDTYYESYFPPSALSCFSLLLTSYLAACALNMLWSDTPAPFAASSCSASWSDATASIWSMLGLLGPVGLGNECKNVREHGVGWKRVRPLNENCIKVQVPTTAAQTTGMRQVLCCYCIASTATTSNLSLPLTPLLTCPPPTHPHTTLFTPPPPQTCTVSNCRCLCPFPTHTHTYTHMHTHVHTHTLPMLNIIANTPASSAAKSCCTFCNCRCLCSSFFRAPSSSVRCLLSVTADTCVDETQQEAQHNTTEHSMGCGADLCLREAAGRWVGAKHMQCVL